jgi:hypothetical protein
MAAAVEWAGRVRSGRNRAGALLLPRAAGGWGSPQEDGLLRAAPVHQTPLRLDRPGAACRPPRPSPQSPRHRRRPPQPSQCGVSRIPPRRPGRRRTHFHPAAHGPEGADRTRRLDPPARFPSSASSAPTAPAILGRHDYRPCGLSRRGPLGDRPLARRRRRPVPRQPRR